jgi:uncharacterized protein (TIGR02147 family)
MDNNNLDFEFSDFGRKLLRRELDRRLETNSRYSLRAFSRFLRMSAGELSEIMSGRRTLTPRAAKKISLALSLSPAEERQLISATLKPVAPAPMKGPSSLALDEDQFRFLGDWSCFAILNLIDAEKVKWDSKRVARRLGLDVAQASSAMARLVRLNLVQVQNGFAQAIRPTGDEIVSVDSVGSSAAIRRYHRDLLLKGVEAIESQAPDVRELGGIGFALAPEDVVDVKKMIRDFQDELLGFVERRAKRRRKMGQTLEVYQLQMILFRLSHPLSGGSGGK